MEIEHRPAHTARNGREIPEAWIGRHGDAAHVFHTYSEARAWLDRQMEADDAERRAHALIDRAEKAANQVLARVAELHPGDEPARGRAEGAAHHITHGMHPGSAVWAIVCGDLYRLIGNADSTTRRVGLDIAQALLWYAPSGAVGPGAETWAGRIIEARMITGRN